MIECILATRGISTDVNGSWRPCCRYEQPTRQKEYKMPWMSKSSSLNDLHNSKEMIKLREALNEMLKTMTYDTLIEKSAARAENLQKQLKYFRKQFQHLLKILFCLYPPKYQDFV